MQNEKNKIGALWTQTSKNGLKYLKGVLNTKNGDMRIVIFPAKFHSKDKAPDMIIYLDKEKK